MNEIEGCRKTEIYIAQMEGASFEEARAVMIGMYSEKELDSDTYERIRVHLEECLDCRQILIDLQSLEEFMGEKLPIPYAVCPSNETLDAYHSVRQSLRLEDRVRVEQHVQQCPLCKEELSYLNQLDPRKKTLVLPARSWTSYVPAVAAMLFLLLSLAMIWQNSRQMVPDHQLRALAVIKEPNQINIAALRDTSPDLPAADQRDFDKGVDLFKGEHFGEASHLFQSLLQKHPDHSATQMLLGYSYYRLGKPDQAFALCDQAERAQPHSIERCMLLVNVALKTGHFDRAVTEITSLYHAASGHPEVSRLYHQIRDLTNGRLLRL